MPGGDTFQVYPGPDGEPIESIRMMVFEQCLCDMRALKLLESLTSREHVLELIGAGLEHELTFSDYPRTDEYLTSLRARGERRDHEKAGLRRRRAPARTRRGSGGCDRQTAPP